MPNTRPKPPIIKEAKSIDLMSKRFAVISGEDREHQFLRHYFATLLSYTAERVPEIADEIFLIDDAMRAGYVWDYGPFEYWDLLGVSAGIDMIESCGWSVPEWVKNAIQRNRSILQI